MSRIRKWTILVHRYLGIALCLLFFLWFVSGIGMIYTGGMPTLTRDERLRRMPALDLAKVRIAPQDAADRAGHPQSPSRARLLTIQDRPAYRFGIDGPTIFADTGEPLDDIDSAESVRIAARFMNVPPSAVHPLEPLEEPDQWTISERRHLPLYKLAVDDPARSVLYVSESLGEVVMRTTLRSRTLAWLAAIPHWLYFAPLRSNDRWWTAVVLWTSGVGTIAVLLGLMLAVMQYGVRYRGIMRWHYVTGLTFGGFALTWVFSGLLSMQPGDWASGDDEDIRVREALSGGRLDLSKFSALDPSAWMNLAIGPIKELEFRRIFAEPYYVARGEGPPSVIAARSLRLQGALGVDAIMARIRTEHPAVAIQESQVLPDYDSYYYDRQRSAPLPVLRIKFADRERTWVYVDPLLSEVVAQFTRRQRWERWLYHGLHSLDFPFWYYRRPLWDISVIALCAGGALLSGLGVVIGFRRVRRATARSVARFTAPD